MTTPADRTKRRRGRWRTFRWLAGLGLAVVILAVGIAVGRALQDNPKPGLTITTTKTIVP